MYSEWNQRLEPEGIPPVRPNYSIDLVIDRVHHVAENVHELTHVVNKHAKEVIKKGEETLTKFNVHYANVSTTVEDMINVVRDRTYSIPLDIFFAALICALILIVLAMCYLVVFGSQRYAQKKYLGIKPRII